jgi:hypothetical protein
LAYAGCTECVLFHWNKLILYPVFEKGEEKKRLQKFTKELPGEAVPGGRRNTAGRGNTNGTK